MNELKAHCLGPGIASMKQFAEHLHQLRRLRHLSCPPDASDQA
jgi:hypothetical protein